MTAEIPVELLQLRTKLQEMFAGKLPEVNIRDLGQREDNFLSRSLAAYVIYKLSGSSLEEATESVVDGGGDRGIDAIFYSSTTQILWVAQSKFIKNGSGEPSYKDVNEFVNDGLYNLLKGNFEVFKQNQAWVKLIPKLEGVFKKVTQVRPILVYSSINSITEDRRRLFEDFKQRFYSDDEDNFIDFQVCNLTTVHDWLVGADAGFGVQQVELKLLMPSWLRREYPYETVLGLLPLKDLADLYAEHGKKLVVSNIRAYKGSTEVNTRIMATIENEPENFFYLNNGLTAYCARFEVHPLDRNKHESKRITVYDLSIVNGAQTLGSIAEFFKKNPDAVPQGNVFIKIISVLKCEDDRAFAERITRSTNFQNQIGLKDFVALDENQQRIAKHLILSGITYHHKDDAETPDPDETNFTLNEATTASACLAKTPDCYDFCARIVADRDSLWSMDEIYPTEELLRSRYARIFRPDRSARTVWRAVQTQRLVIKVMQDSSEAEGGLRGEFFNYAVWLILHVIFIKLRPEQGNDLSLTEHEANAVSQRSIELAEELWSLCEDLGYVSRRSLGGIDMYEAPQDFRSVFSDVSDCERLRKGLLARLPQDRR